jgi:hypothetical protein
MSASFQIDIKDQATPELKRKIEALRPARVNEFVGGALKNLLKHNFLAQPHNKKGWQPLHFWSGAAQSTHYQVIPEGVVLSTSQIGVRQRYQGGTIRPVNAKALAIPVAEEAYGTVPKEYGDQLKLVVIKGKGAWLALKSYEQRPKDEQRGRKQIQGPGISTVRERLKFLFALSASVDQKPNPGVLPSMQEITDTAVEAVKAAIK